MREMGGLFRRGPRVALEDSGNRWADWLNTVGVVRLPRFTWDEIFVTDVMYCTRLAPRLNLMR